jgi:hypothetical protein
MFSLYYTRTFRCQLHESFVYKSGRLNLLEPQESVQACNGIAVPLHIDVSA